MSALEKSPKTWQRIAQIKETCAARGRKLTPMEACELTGIKVRQNLDRMVKQHPELRQFIEIRPQAPYRLPQEMIPQIEQVVRGLIANHRTPTDDLVAMRLSMTRKQFARWVKNHVPNPAELGVLFPHERLKVLCLSVGRIFQDFGLEFEPRTLVSILQRKEDQVMSYLKRNDPIRNELIRMGMAWPSDEE